MIKTLTLIYFGINIFTAGYYIGNNIQFDYNIKDKTRTILAAFLLGLIAVQWVLVSLLIALIENIYYKVNSVFQLSFFFKFYFTKTYNNLDEPTLEMYHKIAFSKNAKTLHGKIFIYGVKLIGKRNNYVYKPEIEKH